MSCWMLVLKEWNTPDTFMWYFMLGPRILKYLMFGNILEGERLERGEFHVPSGYPKDEDDGMVSLDETERG